MTMTKAEMITRVCEKTQVSKEEATYIIEGTFEMIKAFLERGETVKISTFGSFVIRTKRPRKGRNPLTGAEIIIPGHKALRFKASPIMKKIVATTPSN